MVSLHSNVTEPRGATVIGRHVRRIDIGRNILQPIQSSPEIRTQNRQIGQHLLAPGIVTGSLNRQQFVRKVANGQSSSLEHRRVNLPSDVLKRAFVGQVVEL